MSVCPVPHQFDPFGEAFQTDPAAALCDESPVFFSQPMGWYVITRYDDIRAVSRDQECFSSSVFGEPVVPLGEPALAMLAEYGYRGSTSLGSLDPPQHSIRRKLMHQPFKPVNTARWESRVREIHCGYIEAFADRGQAELVADYFWHAPAVVALEFMGVPDEDIAEVKQFAAGVLEFIFGRPTEQQQVAACELMGRHYAYASELIQRMLERAPHGPGVLAHACRLHREAPEAIDREFLVSLAINTLAAAHETTSTSLANAVLVLLEDPSRWDALCADPSLIGNAVEESLRLRPSLTTNRRLCVKDTVVGGVPIPAGARVLLGVASANCDPEVFEMPDAFDIARPTAKRHLTFGYGPHTCLGAPLARLQMRVALEELSARFPDMRLVAGHALEYPPSSASRAPRALEVEWSVA